MKDDASHLAGNRNIQHNISMSNMSNTEKLKNLRKTRQIFAHITFSYLHQEVSSKASSRKEYLYSIMTMDTAQTSTGSERFMRHTREPAIKVPLPTGETISNYQLYRRSHIPGFPAATEILPTGILTEDIIKQWPNHLVRTSWAHIISQTEFLSLESCLGTLWSLRQCSET